MENQANPRAKWGGYNGLVRNIADDYFSICNGCCVNPPIPERRSTPPYIDDWIRENLPSVKEYEEGFQISESLRDFTAERERQSFIDGFRCALALMQEETA